jgi:hypothetical protein
MSQLQDFSVTVHSMDAKGFQADLMWEGGTAPFARFCAHEVGDKSQDATLFVVADGVTNSPEIMTHVIEHMARIMLTQLDTGLAACTIFQRIDPPDPPIPSETRHMHISLSGEIEQTHRLIIRSIAKENYEEENFDPKNYRNVAVAECLLNGKTPQVTMIMQDESLMTEQEAEGLARWLAKVMKWPKDTAIDILRGRFVVQFQAETDEEANQSD